MPKPVTSNAVHIKLQRNIHTIQSHKHIATDFNLLSKEESFKHNGHHPLYSPAELAHNLDVVSSKPYQDLIAKFRMLKSEKEQLISQLKHHKK